MSEGYRISYTKDQTAWGNTILIRHPGGEGRKPKDYVFRLESDGTIIVSETIWQRLNEIKAAGFDHGFVYVNSVSDPPTQNPMSIRQDNTRRIFKDTDTGLSETELKALQSVVPKGFKPKAN